MCWARRLCPRCRNTSRATSCSQRRPAGSSSDRPARLSGCTARIRRVRSLRGFLLHARFSLVAALSVWPDCDEQQRVAVELQVQFSVGEFELLRSAECRFFIHLLDLCVSWIERAAKRFVRGQRVAVCVVNAADGDGSIRGYSAEG